jgi:AcrR family transcriptional regulator
VVTEHPPIPPGLARLWQPTGEASPSREALSSARIVQAAVELADSEGLDAVSMARVADRLGAGTMSLYRHVANKDELLLLMHDSVWRTALGDVETADTSDGWRPALVRWCARQHVTLAAHPWLERIRFVERAGTPSQMAAFEQGMAILAGTPLREADKVAVLWLINGYLMWTARYTQEMRTAAVALGSTEDAITGQFGMLLGQLVAQGRYPATARAVAAGVFAAPDAPFADFDYGLTVILDGIETLMEGR